MLCMEVIQVSTRGRIETVQGSASAVKREYLMYLDMRALLVYLISRPLLY